MMVKSGCILTGVAVACVTAVIPAMTTPASAKPPYVNAWSDLYPASLTDDNLDNGGGSACQLCHAGPFGGQPWNGYGWSLQQVIVGNDIGPAILAVQDLSSDNDPNGCSNTVEINADTQPGWTDGPNNTLYFEDGSTQENQPPPPDALGDLDPSMSCCAADFDGDGSVGITDFLTLLAAWGSCPSPPQACPADLDNDNEVGITDFLALLGDWGLCT